MRIVLYPFFSQQCKLTRKFRLDSDSGVRLYEYLGRQLQARGHDVVLCLPPYAQCTEPLRTPLRVGTLPALEIDNLDRRLQWMPQAWRFLTRDCDLLLTQHEHLPYALRALGYRGKLVMEVGMRPDTAYGTQELFPLNWKACDLIHCNSDQLASELVTYHGVRNTTTTWCFAVEDSLFATPKQTRDIDVLFNARASATDYSNHRLFYDMCSWRGYKIRFTDPTGYLAASHEAPSECLFSNLSREQYVDVMCRSRVVVTLTLNGYGGYAFREAMACGAVPVTPNAPEFVELLGRDWPYLCHVGTPGSVAKAVQRALDGGVPPQWDAAYKRLRKSSYSATAAKAVRELEELCAVTVSSTSSAASALGAD